MSANIAWDEHKQRAEGPGTSSDFRGTSPLVRKERCLRLSRSGVRVATAVLRTVRFRHAEQYLARRRLLSLVLRR